jgi:surface carbohydrate biosynthesis protein
MISRRLTLARAPSGGSAAGVPLQVALVVDHPGRDLAGLVLTALELVRRGITCHFVPLNLQDVNVWALAPDFVLLNYLRPSNEPFARQLYAAGITFGVLDTEGAVWTHPDEYASLLWKDVALLRQAQAVCMWGPRLAAHVQSRGFFAAPQVQVTGCPRFDLYFEPWRHLADDVAEAESCRERTFLINTNFSVSNPRFTTAARSIALHRSVLGYSDAQLRRVVEDEQRAMAGMLTLADALAAAYPASRVIIRPHPFEDPTPYTALQRRNVTVDQVSSVQGAIAGACAVIQRSCTTAIEATIAGVPALSPQWLPAPFLMPPAEAASIPCASFDELRRHLDLALVGKRCPPAGWQAGAEAVVRECCHLADGRSHVRAADAVSRALRPVAVDRARCRRLLYSPGDGDKPANARLGAWARHSLGLSPQWSWRRFRRVPPTEWRESRKSFGPDDVRHLVERAQRLAGGVWGSPGSLVVETADRALAHQAVTLAPRAGSLPRGCSARPATT